MNAQRWWPLIIEKYRHYFNGMNDKDGYPYIVANQGIVDLFSIAGEVVDLTDTASLTSVRLDLDGGSEIGMVSMEFDVSDSINSDYSSSEPAFLSTKITSLCTKEIELNCGDKHTIIVQLLVDSYILIPAGGLSVNVSVKLMSLDIVDRGKKRCSDGDVPKAIESRRRPSAK